MTKLNFTRITLHMTANFWPKKALDHHDFAYDMDAKSHPTPDKFVQGFLKYSPGVLLAMYGCFNWIHGAIISKKERKLHRNGKFGVAILVTAWALKVYFLQGMYVFIIFFVWTCYSHTQAYGLGLSWTRIDAYWQNFVVLVAICGHKVNLHFANRWTKNKDSNSVWQ